MSQVDEYGRNYPGVIIHKFGRNTSVGTSFTPLNVAGIYRTPQVGAATKVRVKAGNANDTAAGSGAQEVTVQGLDENGDEVFEKIATAGASASGNTATNFIRLYRAWVSASGTYATTAAGSHTADIVIENAAGTEDWMTIVSTDYPRGQSEVGCYSVPAGYHAYLRSLFIFADTSKTTDVLFLVRENILDTEAPYKAARLKFEISTTDGTTDVTPLLPAGPYIGPCDMLLLAKVDSSTATVDCDFEVTIFKQ